MQVQSQRSLVCRRFSLALRGLLAFAAVFAASLCLVSPAAHAQAKPAAGQGQAVASSATPARTVGTAARGQLQTANAVTKPSGKGMHEGITVHGWWVIEVRNPDGTLTQRREFENSLTFAGPQALAQILAGWEVPGGWVVLLTDPTNTTSGSPCQGAGTCYLFQPSAASTAAQNFDNNCEITPKACSANITLSLGNSNTSLVLQGSIQATQIGNVGAVATFLNNCTPSTNPDTAPNTPSLPMFGMSPSQCNNTGNPPAQGGPPAGLQFSAGNQPFTAASLTSPVESVQIGQTVSVTVTFSFQ